MREIIVKWDGTQGLHFGAVSANGATVALDSMAEYGGPIPGFSPKTLLLTALGGCTGMDVLSILRKMRQNVRSYQVEIKGWEHEEHPKKFDRVTVEHVVEGHGLSQELVDRAIKLSHEKYCGVTASLAGSVEITMVARLVEVE